MAWETAMIPIGACVGALTAVFMVKLLFLKSIRFPWEGKKCFWLQI